MGRNYGMPYMGSKSKIANWVIENLPPADNFVDLFAGGCAVTHAALLSGKYKRFIINDITGSAKVFLEAINGRFKDENRWISREDFFRLKNDDLYVRLCFSFGNNQRAYAYNEEKEPYKRALHYAIVFQDNGPLRELGIDIPNHLLSCDTVNARRVAIKRYLGQVKNDHHAGDLQSLESLDRLQSLESLGRIKNVGGGKIEAYQLDYKDVPIPESGTTVIYCDPPYRGTGGYLTKFDHNLFDEWCRGHKENVFISEYTMPDDFKRIASVRKLSLMDANNNGLVKTESIWIHESVDRRTGLFGW